MNPVPAIAAVVAFTASAAAGGPPPPKVVVAIRYFQQEGTSHARLYVTDTSARSMRQITTGSNGQDQNPVWSPDGRSIAYQRELPNGIEWRMVNADGANDHAANPVPSWYFADIPPAMDDAPCITNTECPDPRLYPAAVKGPLVFSARDGGATLIFRDRPTAGGEEPGYYPKAVFFTAKTGSPETAVDKLPVFQPAGASGDPEGNWGAPLPRGSVPHQRTDSPVGEDEPLESNVLMAGANPFVNIGGSPVAFLIQHRGSTDGSAFFALNPRNGRLFGVAPNGGTVIPLPTLSGVACVCYQRYLPLGAKSVNCSYLDLWSGDFIRTRVAEQKPARFYGASILAGDDGGVLSIRRPP